jgi:ATP-binding cassette subfamily B protein
LLTRLYDIQDGAIFIDAQNISKVTQDSLREQISLIPQEPMLFHRTLMENIRYGKIDATDEEVIAASKLAFAHEFIEELPQGYKSLVGERGIKLSGGQRQRVAIARAILKNSLILILDEATSSLDSKTEKLIQNGLDNLMRGKTVVVIAHRLSTISHMDRIVVFDQGKIVEQGSHEELLKSDGHYSLLWRMQAGGFLPQEPVDDIVPSRFDH